MISSARSGMSLLHLRKRNGTWNVDAFAIVKDIATRGLQVPVIFVVEWDDELALPALRERRLVGASGVGSPVAPGRTSLPPPRLGEHMDEILRELGYDAPSVARMRADGIV